MHIDGIPCALGAAATCSMLSVAHPVLAQTDAPKPDGSAFAMAASDGPETRKMKAMIRGIEYITLNSTLEYAGQALPEVTVVTEQELQLRALSPEARTTAGAKDHAPNRVAAFYDREANNIFLAEVNSIEGPGLFHELVHFLQDINGKTERFADHRPCLEAEAYELQADWQTENQVDLALKPAYGFIMTLYGVCNDADFSWIHSDVVDAD